MLNMTLDTATDQVQPDMGGNPPRLQWKASLRHATTCFSGSEKPHKTGIQGVLALAMTP